MTCYDGLRRNREIEMGQRELEFIPAKRLELPPLTENKNHGSR